MNYHKHQVDKVCLVPIPKEAKQVLMAAEQSHLLSVDILLIYVKYFNIVLIIKLMMILYSGLGLKHVFLSFLCLHVVIKEYNCSGHTVY